MVTDALSWLKTSVHWIGWMLSSPQQWVCLPIARCLSMY